MAVGFEFAPQPAAGIVKSLVERTAGGPQPPGENVDRNFVQGEGDEDPPLVRSQCFVDGFAERIQQLGSLEPHLRRIVVIGEALPGIGLKDDLTPLPGPTPKLYAGLEQRELVCPGREAALAAEVAELGKHCHQGVISGLHCEIVEFLGSRMSERCPAPGDLMTRSTQEQPV